MVARGWRAIKVKVGRDARADADRLRAVRDAIGPDVFLSVGTSTVVYPAAQLPFEALRHGKVVLEVNPTDTPLSASATFALRGPSGEVLPRLVEAAFG